ncbi:MAG: DNA-binding response regulator, partial [Spirochaetaceae bacterium]
VTTGATMWKARALASLERGEESRRELSTLGVAEGEPLPPGTERAGLVLARVMMAEAADASYRRTTALTSLLDLLEQRARSGGELRVLVETLLVKGRLAEILGKTSEAEASREAAIAAGKPAGYYQIFLDEQTGDVEDGVRSAAPAAVPLRPPPATSPSSDSSGLVEELSEREKEVLQLAGEGLSNDDIGQKLFISSGTVKWHLSNIFGKLGVSKRTRAIAVAREVGLLK